MGSRTPRAEMDPEELKQRRAAARREDKLRKMGKPLKVYPYEFETAKKLLAVAREAGMDDELIATQVGLCDTAIHKIRTSNCGMRRSTYDKIMSLRPEEPVASHHPTRGKIPKGVRMPPTGTVRRLRALRADGFANSFIASVLGVSAEAVSDLVRNGMSRKCYRTTYNEVRELYAKYAGTDPKDFIGQPGMTRHGINYTKTWARKANYAPTMCWDDDTIDDPNAIPEWTGACGTVEGYYIHLRMNIQVRNPNPRHGKSHRIVDCEPCTKARSLADIVGVHGRTDQAGIKEALLDGGTIRGVAREFAVNEQTVLRMRRELKEETDNDIA